MVTCLALYPCIPADGSCWALGGAARPLLCRGFVLWDPCLVFGSSSRGGKAPVDVKPSINKAQHEQGPAGALGLAVTPWGQWGTLRVMGTV